MTSKVYTAATKQFRMHEIEVHMQTVDKIEHTLAIPFF